MNHWHRIAVVSIALLLSAAAFPIYQQPQRDPTAQDPLIRDALGLRSNQPPVAPSSSPGRPRAPQVTLKALVVAAGREGTAIIQCGDALYTIHAGATIAAWSTPSMPVDLRVLRISADEVRLEVASSGEVLILR
jgi:hypothetical protein